MQSKESEFIEQFKIKKYDNANSQKSYDNYIVALFKLMGYNDITKAQIIDVVEEQASVIMNQFKDYNTMFNLINESDIPLSGKQKIYTYYQVLAKNLLTGGDQIRAKALANKINENRMVEKQEEIKEVLGVRSTKFTKEEYDEVTKLIKSDRLKVAMEIFLYIPFRPSDFLNLVISDNGNNQNTIDIVNNTIISMSQKNNFGIEITTDIVPIEWFNRVKELYQVGEKLSNIDGKDMSIKQLYNQFNLIFGMNNEQYRLIFANNIKKEDTKLLQHNNITQQEYYEEHKNPELIIPKNEYNIIYISNEGLADYPIEIRKSNRKYTRDLLIEYLIKLHNNKIDINPIKSHQKKLALLYKILD